MVRGNFFAGAVQNHINKNDSGNDLYGAKVRHLCDNGVPGERIFKIALPLKVTERIASVVLTLVAQCLRRISDIVIQAKIFPFAQKILDTISLYILTFLI